MFLEFRLRLSILEVDCFGRVERLSEVLSTLIMWIGEKLLAISMRTW